MSAVFTVEAIQTVVGTDFVAAERGPNRNVKLDLTRLVTPNQARGFTDDQKLDVLYAAREKLRAEGYECTVRLQQRNSDGVWKNWPHIWVNRSGASTSPDLENRLAAVEQSNALLTELIAELRAQRQAAAETPEPELDADGDGVVEEPDAESVEF